MELRTIDKAGKKSYGTLEVGLPNPPGIECLRLDTSPYRCHSGAVPQTPRSGLLPPCKVAPADPILGLAAQFKEDTHPKKVNLGIGAYRDTSGTAGAQRWRSSSAVASRTNLGKSSKTMIFH